MKQTGFAPFAFDVVLFGIAKATVALYAGFSRMPGGLGCQQLGHIDFGGAGMAGEGGLWDRGSLSRGERRGGGRVRKRG